MAKHELVAISSSYEEASDEEASEICDNDDDKTELDHFTESHPRLHFDKMEIDDILDAKRRKFAEFETKLKEAQEDNPQDSD